MAAARRGSLLSLSKSFDPSFDSRDRSTGRSFSAFGDELTDTLGTTLTCNFVLQTDDDASLIDGERDSERCGIDESAFFFF